MNILRYILVLITATGFGFGLEEVISSNVEKDNLVNEDINEDSYRFGFCHSNIDYFLDQMIERLTDEEQIIVQAKIDELLAEYDMTIDQLNSDFNLRYNFMNDLMNFLDESGFDYHYDYTENSDYPNHMGMRR